MQVASTSFGERLKQLREKAGLTQYALAKASGVTAQAIANIERGSEPTWPTVIKLARALGVNVSEFDQGDEEPPAATPARKLRKPRK